MYDESVVSRHHKLSAPFASAVPGKTFHPFCPLKRFFEFAKLITAAVAMLPVDSGIYLPACLLLS